MLEIERNETIKICGITLDAEAIEKLQLIISIGKKDTLDSIVNILTAIAQTGIAKFEDGSQRIDSDDIHLLKMFYDFINAIPVTEK